MAPVRVPHTHAHRHLRTVEGPPPKEVSCQTMLASEAVLLVRAQVGTTRTRFWFLRCLPIGAYYNLCILGTCQLSGVDPCNYPNLHQSAFLFFVISRRPFRTSCPVTWKGKDDLDNSRNNLLRGGTNLGLLFPSILGLSFIVKLT